MDTEIRKQALEVTANCIDRVVEPVLSVSAVVLLLMIMNIVQPLGVALGWKEAWMSFNQNGIMATSEIPVNLSNAAINQDFHYSMFDGSFFSGRSSPNIG